MDSRKLFTKLYVYYVAYIAFVLAAINDLASQAVASAHVDVTHFGFGFTVGALAFMLIAILAANAMPPRGLPVFMKWPWVCGAFISLATLFVFIAAYYTIGKDTTVEGIYVRSAIFLLPFLANSAVLVWAINKVSNEVRRQAGDR